MYIINLKVNVLYILDLKYFENISFIIYITVIHLVSQGNPRCSQCEYRGLIIVFGNVWMLLKKL